MVAPTQEAAPRPARGWLGVEAPVLLLLVSTLVWRVRPASDIAADPLDSAGAFRVACVGLAGLLGVIAVLVPGAGARARPLSLPFRLYLLYITVVFAGALLSVNLPLTAYRCVELVACVLVLLGARMRLGASAVPRIEATLYWFTVALLASVWIGVVFFPDQAIQHFSRTVPIPWSIQGVYPAVSSNSVGTLGATLTVWSLTRMDRFGRRVAPRRVLGGGLAAVGILSLLVAQYRTGYVALALALTVLLLVRRRRSLAALLIVVAIGIAVWTPSLIQRATPYALRGTSVQEAKGLDSRVNWWSAALPVWRESPLLGRGLLTATRFEVFARLGLETTSSIHGTWIEALVGTGLLGSTLLALSFLTALRGASALAVRQGRALPLMLLTVMGVRSFTGPTFESFSQQTMMLLWIALVLAEVKPPGNTGLAVTASEGRVRAGAAASR